MVTACLMVALSLWNVKHFHRASLTCSQFDVLPRGGKQPVSGRDGGAGRRVEGSLFSGCWLGRWGAARDSLQGTSLQLRGPQRQALKGKAVEATGARVAPPRSSALVRVAVLLSLAGAGLSSTMTPASQTSGSLGWLRRQLSRPGCCRDTWLTLPGPGDRGSGQDCGHARRAPCLLLVSRET